MESTSSTFSTGEHVDILEDTQRWVNGVIQRVDSIKRHIVVKIAGTWFQIPLPFDSPRVQKQWMKGMEFRINNRLDIYDVSDKLWREAFIVDIKHSMSPQKSSAIRIQYRGFNQSSQEWIDCQKEAARIMEIGSKSGAEGQAKYSLRIQQELRDKEEDIKRQLKNCQPQKVVDGGSGWGLKYVPKEEFDYSTIDWQKEEQKFERELSQKNLRIIQMGRDGNCLFRAIAHQAYGDEELHRLIRLKCVDYILKEKEYFKDFIIGGDESNLEAYVIRKRQNAVWGDDLEIQALSEIYNRPIEIYAYSKEPMRTFHEQAGVSDPFRLSYHGSSHYNSIVPTNWNYDKVFIKEKEGVVEDEAIKQCTLRQTSSQELEEIETEIAKEVSKAVFNYRLMAQMIQRSREDFQIQSQRDMEEALKKSMAETYTRPPINSTALYKQIENENIKKAIAESQQEQISEEEMIKRAMEESMKEIKQKESNNGLAGINLDDALMRTMMALSTSEQIDINQMSEGVRYAVNNGFTIEQAVEAQTLVGDDPNSILNYLFDKISLT